MDNDDLEHSSLMGRSKPIASKIFSIFIVAILIFSFFAFVFATASFTATKNLKHGVSNNFYNQQGGLIQETYAVPSYTPSFEAGRVLSFCDSSSPAGGVCPGLGPKWNETLYPAGSFAPATYADLVQISPDLAVYAWVSPSAPSTLRIVSIKTSADPPSYVGAPTLLPLAAPLSWLSLKAYGTNNVVIAYTASNASHLIAAAVPLTAPVQFGIPVDLFEVPMTTDTFAIDLLILQNAYILVTYGVNYAGAAFLAFTLTGSTLNSVNIARSGYGIQITNDLASVYLGPASGNEYFLQATGDKAALGSFVFSGNTLTLNILKSITFTSVLYDSITATSLFNGYIALAGVQTELLANALTISMALQWSTTPPYITAFFPNNLLENQGHELINQQLSVCYAPATTGEPRGELYFTYVDSKTDRAKLIRAKIAATASNDVQILPSPAIDISTFTYTQYGTSIGPLVACPSPAGVLVAYQYLGTYFNTFVWQGGYRFAGLAQEHYSATSGKSTVLVMRQGISDVHTNLQAGFPYYVSNAGYIHAHSSVVELFSSASFNTRIGIAVKDTQLMIDNNAFEEIAYGGGGTKRK